MHARFTSLSYVSESMNTTLDVVRLVYTFRLIDIYPIAAVINREVISLCACCRQLLSAIANNT